MATTTRGHSENTIPSKVLHFRNVQSPITQAEVLDLCQQAGPVEYIMMLSHADQAFVQFQSQEVATAFLNHAQTYPPKIHDKTLYVQYSKHQSIKQNPTPRPPGSPSKVLLVTILNPLYVISIDVLSQIFSPYEQRGKQVEKIIIFQKRSSLQALIQYSSQESAKAAMDALNGKNIYKSCCQLQIQFSKQSELTIAENSEHSRDFSNPSLPTSKAKPHLPSNTLINAFHPMGPMGFPGFAQGMPGMMTGMSGMGMGGAMNGMGGAAMASMAGLTHMYRTVIIVNGFPPTHVGCDQLFNLFSNYGNIVRIKILYEKPNTALIQYTEPIMAQNAVQYLKDIPVYGSVLNVNFSKLPQISPSKEIREAVSQGKPVNPTRSDGRASSDARTVDYEESTLNRYNTRNMAINLKHVTAPTQYLHVSNLAPSVTQEKLSDLMGRVTKPEQIKLFEKDQHAMALVQFSTIEQAVNAMCFLHNELLEGKHIRLAFTKSRI